MKKVKLLLTVFILITLVGCTNKLNLNPGIGASEYYRLDLKNLDLEAPLGNLRIITKGQYELGKAKEKYHLDEEYVIDQTGLNTLNISGSRQFSKDQFIQLADQLKKVAGESKVYIIDLRQENHGFANGYPISYYKEHNWANKELTNAQIEKNQRTLFSNLKNKRLTAYLKGDDEKASEDFVELNVKEYISEEDLVKSQGFEYLNIPCVDHVFPSPENIDNFIEFVKTIDTDNSWLHFHCVAGEGRTGTFMCLYDMMKNPEVSMRDIAYRQTKLGSNYPLYIQEKDDWKKDLYQEKADQFVLLYKYVQENYKNNYDISWSEWLTKNSLSVDVLRVSMLPLSLNGEYGKTLLEKMWKEIEPNIKLEFVDTEYSETNYPEGIDVSIRSMENLRYLVNQNHYRQLYKDEIDSYNDLVNFAKDNIEIDERIYGIPWLICDNLLFYYKDDKEMSKVTNVYELVDALSNKENIPVEVSNDANKIYYDKHSYDYYALDSSIDENEEYAFFSSENCKQYQEEIYQNIKCILDNGTYADSRLKNIEEFLSGKGRAIICFSEELSNADINLNKLAVKKISFAEENDIPLLFMDEICISEHVKDEVKFAKCLKLANLLASKEYIESFLLYQNKPQYFIPTLESVFVDFMKYPLYPDFYEIINRPDIKIASGNEENLNDVIKVIQEYQKSKEENKD